MRGVGIETRSGVEGGAQGGGAAMVGEEEGEERKR